MPVPRQLLPTAESAAGIRRKYDLAVRQRSIFSARTTQARYLDTLRNVLAAWEAGRLRQDEAEEILRQKLDQLGYDPEAGGFPGDVGIPPAKPGTLRDLSSHARLDLVLRHQQAFGRNLARKAASAADPLEAAAWPAWRLARFGSPVVPRNWVPRWQSAYAACGGEGACEHEFVALKSSPIWAALGEVGDDGTGSDVPPFAYNSTMGWEDVDRAEAVRLGLIGEDEPVEIDFSDDEGLQNIADVLSDLSPEDRAALEAEMAQLQADAALARDLARIANTAPPPGRLCLANENPWHCPKCGKFAGFNGHCGKCGYTLSPDESMKRAERLMHKAKEGGVSHPVEAIAYRDGLGQIDLDVGKLGVGRGMEHGKGLSKIAQKHEEKISLLPHALSHGRIFRLRAGNDPGKPFDDSQRAIVDGTTTVFLEQKGKDRWFVTSIYTNPAKVRKIERAAAK